ncbi:translation initiation factor IF-2-like isoform X1 [Canis lupus familiaris]|uniref:translation initiation factor IF-2-like isoform X1 n=1 Tax=Canis lupus familiaris TaxID=9615 RepID=UPI0018F71D3E|nr:translation initiation factor IF-2-like isoform X1 [Canis lupus familiaris]
MLPTCGPRWDLHPPFRTASAPDTPPGHCPSDSVISGASALRVLAASRTSPVAATVPGLAAAAAVLLRVVLLGPGPGPGPEGLQSPCPLPAGAAGARVSSQGGHEVAAALHAPGLQGRWGPAPTTEAATSRPRPRGSSSALPGPCGAGGASRGVLRGSGRGTSAPLVPPTHWASGTYGAAPKSPVPGGCRGGQRPPPAPRAQGAGPTLPVAGRGIVGTRFARAFTPACPAPSGRPPCGSPQSGARPHPLTPGRGRRPAAVPLASLGWLLPGPRGRAPPASADFPRAGAGRRSESQGWSAGAPRAVPSSHCPCCRKAIPSWKPAQPPRPRRRT